MSHGKVSGLTATSCRGVCVLDAVWSSTTYGLLHGYIDNYAYSFPSMGKDSVVVLRLVGGSHALGSP